MIKGSIPAICAALACLSSSAIEAFAPSHNNMQQRMASSSSASTRQTQSTALNLWMPIDDHVLSTSSNFLLSTIDSDIASIPDNEFRKVFAGGIFIMFGSVLSTMFVGFLVESGGGSYAELVAETYAEQDMSDEGKESFLDSLGVKSADEKKEALDMVAAFREKKMKKAGTWSEEDEAKKQQDAEEKDMFSDYD